MRRKLVVIAVSGRALAHSAAKRGRPIVVLDAFGDRDTRAVAAVVCVAVDAGVALDPDRLLSALDREAHGAELDIIIGGGLERMPYLASRIEACGRLYANQASTVAALKDPEVGIALMRATGWHVPITQRAPPSDPHGWLQKEAGGAGGMHVRRAGARPLGRDTYFQRVVHGRPMSVTFLADGERAYLLGFNWLRLATSGEAQFCYGGAIGGIHLPLALHDRVQACLDRLVRLTGLRGLAGIDFVRDGDSLIALEINPRPTATFELYDDDFADGLVDWHMTSFERAIPDFDARLRERSHRCRGLGIVYAQRAIEVPNGAEFPAWCRDLPCAGSTIAAGAPVLSVYAESTDAEAAGREIETRSAVVRALLARWHEPEQTAIADARV